MKVAQKFTLAFLATLILGLAFYGYAIIRRETRDFEDAKHNKHVDISRSLLPNIEYRWQTDGEASAREVVMRVDEAIPEVRIRWVSLDPNASEDVRAENRIVESEEPRVIVRDEIMYTYVKVHGPNNESRALEMKEALSHERELVQEAIFEQLIALAGLGLAAATASILLGIAIVGRPIQRLSEQARKIGAGDLSSRSELGGRDEIALLGREMDAMVSELAVAKEARGKAEEQLRHGERLMTVGALASGMAHELGTPLNVVQMRAKLIASGDVVDGEARESGRIIAEQATRMTQIMRQLLDFARRRSPQKARVDLHGVCERVSTFLAPVAQKANIELSVKGSALVCMADASQMEQVVTNLVVNGIQAMQEGGVLTIKAEAREHEACIEVKDTGQGISQENLARIFEPFFTTKEIGQGTGLGLSVAYGIVAEHGGFIEVESELGKGSTFRVHIPMEQA